MATDPQKQEEVRKIILALLLTLKDGCSINDLERDFYESEGMHIPWKSFGYVSLLDYLQNMPQCVRVEKHGNNWYVKGIASDKSKHVNSLVLRQKCQTKKRIGVPKTFRPSHYYPITVPPRFYIPAEILTYIIGLVNQYPDGLNKDYLLSIVQRKIPYSHVVMKDMVDQLQELSHEIYVDDNKIFPKKSLISNQSSKSLPVVKNKELSSIAEKHTSSFCAGGYEKQATYLELNDESDFIFRPAGYIHRHSPESKKNIAVQSTCSFIQETLTNHKIQTNCENTEDRFNNQDDTIKFMNDANVENIKDKCYDPESVNILINERLKFRLKKLIEKYPEGIWCAHLPEIYLEEYNISLNYTELGFHSIREFAVCLPEIFRCVQISPTEDFILYNAKTEIPLTNVKEKSNTSALASVHDVYMLEDPIEALPTSEDTCKKLIPDGVMTLGESVGYINVTDLYERDQYIEVFVVEVFTPSLFWIQLREKRKTFNSLMEHLNTFYTQKSRHYKIPTAVLEKGLNCACLYNDVWHRGIIKTVTPDLRVTVMFYDYGTLKTYPADAIHYLYRAFSNLPAQAIPCGLINTIPCNGNKWSQGVTLEFATRTAQIPLAAMIGSINEEDNSMLVTLTDTMEEEDVHINDWLIDQKLAKHGKMDDAVDMSNLMLYVEENLLYLPERCYASDNTVADTKKNSYNAPTEELSDVPLISPQSVLDNLLLKPPPGIMLSDDAFSLLNTLKENKQNLELISECKASNVSNSDQCNSGTNPFLPNELSCNLGDHLTSESFMRLWNQNLLLQMQITATFNDLLTKVILQVPSKTEHNLCSEQQHDKVLNAFRNMNIQEHNGKGMSIASFNLDSLLSYNAEEKTTNLLHNINSKTDSAISTGSPANVTHPKNLSIHNSTMLYDNDDQHSVINNFKFRIPDKSSINTSIGNLNSTLEKSDVSSEEKNINSSLSSNPFRSVYKSFKMKSEPFLDEKNYVGERDHPNSVQPMIANDVIDNPECSNNLIKTNGNNVTEMQEETAKHKIIRKETNPFKLMLAGKIDIWKDADDYRSNSVNQKSKVTHLNIEDLHQESKGGSFRDIFQDTAICNTSMEKSQNNTTASSDRYIKIRSDLEKRESNKFPRNCDDNIDNVEYVFNKIYKTKPLLYGSQENEKKENIAEENSIDIEVKDLSLSLKENGNKIKQSSIIRWQDNRQVAESYCPEINSCSSLQPRFNNSNSCCNVQQVKGLSTMQENLAFTPHCTLPEMYATQKSKVLNGDCGAEEFASKPFDEQTPVIKNVYGTANDPTFIKKGQPLEFTDCCSEFKSNSNVCTLGHARSSLCEWSPFNVPLFYVAKDNSYVDDEEYLTRPSTSHTRNSLSPPTCSIIGTNCRKQSFFDNRAKSDKLYSNAWYKPVENIDNVTSTNVKETNSLNIEPRLLLAGRKSPVFRVQNKPGNQVTTFCEQRVEPCDAIVKSMKGRAVHLETHHSSDSAATENQLGNIWKMSDWEKVMFSDLKSISWNLPKLNKSLFIFQAIELSSRYMYIFHYQGQGWLSIDEFVEVFTDFKTSLYMIKLLNKFCVDVTINVIHRGAYPLEFSHLDRLLWDVPRDAENKINQINLIPLQSVMNILYKLKIIVHNDIRCLSMELKNKRDRIVYDVSVLTNAYEKLTKLIEERQQYMVST